VQFIPNSPFSRDPISVHVLMLEINTTDQTHAIENVSRAIAANVAGLGRNWKG
jgi:hypothetical protein